MANKLRLAPLFSEPINMEKVNFDILAAWMRKRIYEVLGSDDDEITANYAVNMLKNNVSIFALY